MSFRPYRAALLLGALAMAGTAAHAQQTGPSVSLGSAEARAGETVRIAIDFTAGGEVTSVGFSISFNPELYAEIDLAPCNATLSCERVGSGQIDVQFASDSAGEPLASQDGIGAIDFTIAANLTTDRTDRLVIVDSLFLNAAGEPVEGTTNDGRIVITAVSDSDDDGIADDRDNCPNVVNTDQSDRDGDGVGDVCDNCPDTINPAQTDTDGDGTGNACDVEADADGDELVDARDPCPLDPENRCRIFGELPELAFCEDQAVAPAAFEARLPRRSDIRLASGVAPTDLAIADLDGDAAADVVVAISEIRDDSPVAVPDTEGSLAVHFGAGTSRRLALASRADALATADFDGDGAVDVAVASAATGTVQILTNDGAGELTPAMQAPVEGVPAALAAGDFDGDADVDLAVADQAGDVVAVLVNDGAGALSVAGTLAVGAGPGDVVAADLNGDGALDLATANNDSDDVAVLLNDGAGGFADAITVAAGSGPSALDAVDADSDGDTDLAVANAGGDSGEVLVLTNDGAGGFSPDAGSAAFSAPSAVVGADIDGNGDASILVADAGTDDLAVLSRDAQDGLIVVQRVQLGGFPVALGAGDLNGDGSVDLAAGNAVTGDTSILLNEGGGRFGTTPRFAAGVQPADVAMGDFDGDGDTDAAVANAASNDVSILVNDGAGRMSEATRLQVGQGPSAVVGADLNADALPDLVVANAGSSDLSVLVNNPEQGFAAEQRLAIGSRVPPGAVAAADFNDDGVADIVFTDVDTGVVVVLVNDGTGTFDDVGSTVESGTQPAAVTPADFNADGLSDLALANAGDDEVLILLNQGGAQFGAGQRIAVGRDPRAIAAADFDADGDLDLAVANAASDDVTRLDNDGDGVFTAAGTVPAGVAPFAVAALELDGIAGVDLAVANTQGHDLSVLVNDGAGGLGNERRFATGGFPRGVGAADLTGDGVADLAVPNALTDDVSVLINDGAGSFGDPRADVACRSADEALVVGADSGNEAQQAPACTATGPGRFTAGFALAEDANAADTVDLVAIDVSDELTGEPIASAALRGTITAVNDAPSFTSGGDVGVVEGAGERVIEGWASDISAGPADEADQALDFELTVDDASLFAEDGLPAVDAQTGDLTFTTAAGAVGETVVTAVLRDSGASGEANGCPDNVNTSAPVTFAIVITQEPATLDFEGVPLTSPNEGDDRFAQFNVAHAGGGDAVALEFTSSIDPGEGMTGDALELRGVYNRAPSCRIEDGAGAGANDSGAVRCDADAIPDWQCELEDTSVTCTLANLPVGGTAPLVLHLGAGAGVGQFTVDAELSAANAETQTTQVTVLD